MSLTTAHLHTHETLKIEFLTNPFSFIRSLLSPLYIHLFKLFLPSELVSTNKNHLSIHSDQLCEIILQRTLSFVHYFHASLLNRWLHAATIVPFFCGIFLTMGYLVKVILGLEWTFPFVVVWSVLFVIFAMGIDRYVSMILVGYCVAICYICQVLLTYLDKSNATTIFNSGQFHVLLWGLSLLLVAFLSQVVLGHVWIDSKIPAFLIQEALLITPIYMILSCVLMENPFIRYLPTLKQEIESKATNENFQKFARIQ
ncbi:hypothetical protein C9374_002908 [Naegleria lovaniensis]|uniref:Uncharacterized protein n=1 Tax=Naegleria lovaniensis TaxID=51637 RepID=A0AA88GU14_NAELO|nr:uncharacterized protein C9374_002908 [Naegleria lovaniensis]KAG2385759.1 hypothetical protein C9374_002908 [Naegleria lovaniensis]